MTVDQATAPQQTTPAAHEFEQATRRARLPRATPTNITAIVVAGVFALVLLIDFVGTVTNPPRSSTTQSNSAQSTSTTGLRAYAQLLSGYHYRVHRTTSIGSLNDASPGTIFVLDPDSLTRSEASQLEDHARFGWRVIVGGQLDYQLFQNVDLQVGYSATVTWNVNNQQRWNAKTIDSHSPQAFTTHANAEVEIGDQDAALLTSVSFGSGTMYFLATTDPLRNNNITTSDNAGFAVALAGATTNDIYFVETPPSSGGSGFAALPKRWRTAIVIGCIAAIFWAWSRAKRFGKVDAQERTLAPTRALYLDAMAEHLAQSHDNAAARHTIATAAGDLVLGRQHGTYDMEALATLHNLDADTLRATFGDGTTSQDDAAALAGFRALYRASHHNSSP